LKRNRVYYFDGLRGVAALIVVFSHVLLLFYPSTFNGKISNSHGTFIESWYAFSPLNIFSNGDFMVCIFFVLSGYVLGKKYFITKQVAELTSGMIKRYFRLAIPVVATVLLSYLLFVNNLYFHKQIVSITLSDDWLLTLFNIKHLFISEAIYNGFIGVFVGREFSYNNVLWSVRIEFWGSMVVYAIWAVYDKCNKQAKYVWLLLFVLLPIFAETYYLGLLMGLAILYFEQYLIKTMTTKRKIAMLIIAFVLGSVPSFKEIPDGTLYYFFFFGIRSHALIALYHIVAASCLIIVVMCSGKLQLFFQNPICLFLGKISFALYLLHLLVLCSFTSFLFLNFYKIMSYHSSVFIAVGITMPFMLLLAYIFTQSVDNFSIGFSSKINEYIKKTLN